jgi:thiol-disulfide isomerase/thioredoxin
MNRWLAIVAVAAVGLLLGIAGWQAVNEGGTKTRTSLMGSSFPDLEGKLQTLSQWRGKIMVINFWATWCPPCRDEIPAFIRAQEKYREHGVVFVGIALDSRDKVKAFAQSFGMNYPVLIGGLDAAEAARAAGNRYGGLPFTVILDRSGKTSAMVLGGMDGRRLENKLAPLL